MGIPFLLRFQERCSLTAADHLSGTETQTRQLREGTDPGRDATCGDVLPRAMSGGCEGIVRVDQKREGRHTRIQGPSTHTHTFVQREGRDTDRDPKMAFHAIPKCS
jgi:hypothetical protein